MTQQPYDVLVLGGGPGGCAAAITLARAGFSVAILERTRYAEDRIGDTVPPQTAPWIARLGIAGAIQAVPRLASPGVESLWGDAVPALTDFLFNPYGPGLHVDRTKFDAALAAHAEDCGVVVWRNARPREYRKLNGKWVLTAIVLGFPTTFHSRWIVDATGRSAWFARRQGSPPKSTDRMVGLVVRISSDRLGDQRLALEAVPDGWLYHAPLPRGRAVVALMTDSDLLPSRGDFDSFWNRQLSVSRLVATRFQPADRGGLRVINAATQYSPRVVGPQWIAVGDAAAACDPLSGDGICRALASGCEAGSTIIAADAGDQAAPSRYQSWNDVGVRTTLTEQTHLYRSVDDWSGREFWRRRSGQFASP